MVATAYLLGVSTRRVEKLAESLGVTQLSKSQVSAMAKHLDEQVSAFRNRPLDHGPYAFVWVDALTQRVREGGRIINVHALIAVGVNADGHREISASTSRPPRTARGWLAFLRSCPSASHVSMNGHRREVFPACGLGMSPSFETSGYITFDLGPGADLGLCSGQFEGLSPDVPRTSEVCLAIDGGPDEFVELAIPKLRSGSNFPHWPLERRRRAEQALISVVATAYLLGVSTRRFEKLAESLGVTQLSKSQVSAMAKHLDEQIAEFCNRPLDAGPYAFVWVDALTQKVREGDRIINVHALIAVGVDTYGHREILGLDVATAEDGPGWLAFLRSLTARGLSDVQLVISDAHMSLVNAIGATPPGASRQRCRILPHGLNGRGGTPSPARC